MKQEFLFSAVSKRNRDRSRKRSAIRNIVEERRNLLSSRSNFYVREAYKTLRTNVTFSVTGEDGAKVIIVTSAVQGEGKSMTSCNLAISFAMSEKRVLLIDCDMRRPKLAQLFSLNAPFGLSNVLVDPSFEKESILPTRINGLDVLLAGDIPPNPSELLGSNRMRALLERARKKYDFIILDTPPVNLVTDAVVLAPMTDGVLFVVRSYISERGPVLRALEQMDLVQAKLLGFVFNDAERTRKRYGRYNSKGKYGYYGR